MSSVESQRPRTRVAIVTNIPTPYRTPVFERVAMADDIELLVIFFSGREPDREWDIGEGSYRQVYLSERFLSVRGRFIHLNPDTWETLRSFKPDVVVTTGFNPSHLLAFAYAYWSGVQHVAMTDGTYLSEVKLSPLHRIVRRIVYKRSATFVGASDGSLELYHAYGIEPRRVFKSHLCANNEAFATEIGRPKQFDFIFCGRFVQIKNPLFALKVASEVAKRLGRRVSIVFVGSGEMEDEMRAAAQAVQHEVESFFPGFATQNELPRWYGEARIFLFPTRWEPWGVVANEACAAGIPTLVSPTAGSAQELIRHGENGYILTLDVSRWVDAAVQLLSNPELYARMSARGLELVDSYSYDNAARGIVAACRVACGRPAATPYFGGEDYARYQRVVIIQRRMTHYRIPLFDLLREKLAERHINLTVVFGDPTPAERANADTGYLPWGLHQPARYLLNERLCWHNASGAVPGADLVVVTQENKLIFNHLLTLKRKRSFRLAYWGHGRNFQAANVNSLSERIKRWFSRRADWWFAYTESSAKVIRNLGFPTDQITVLNNSIDTCTLRNDIQSLSSADIEEARRAFGIGAGPVGIALGSLHADKHLAFLISAAEEIHARVPDFQLLVVGDGPERPIIEKAASRADGWIHFLGARSGRDKAILLGVSKVLLNPGMVGLGILDSFVSGKPMVTTDCGVHSPEIAYLKPEVNGLITENSIEAFSTGVIRLLADENLYSRLQGGCKEAAGEINLENTVQRFCDGIERCLGGSILEMSPEVAV
jgi:glycosyltransferase involved in cell wall biosynthesis